MKTILQLLLLWLVLYVATDEPIINQRKPFMPTLFLLSTELGYFLLLAVLCGVDCLRSFPVLKEDFEMKLLPCFRS